jgi:hypothetical protein
MKRTSRIVAAAAAVLSLAVAGAVFAHQEGGMQGMGPMHGMGGMGAGMHGGMGMGMNGMGMNGMGMGMRGMGPMAGMAGDADSRQDLAKVHELLGQHDRIQRRVEKLPDGIRTITESDDPAVAKAIQEHVAKMEARLASGRMLNLFSRTLPVLFEQREKIRSRVETTAKGAAVVQTSTDAAVVQALQAHAREVSEMVRDGHAALMRAAMANHQHAQR